MSYEGYSQVICNNGHYSNLMEDFNTNPNPKCHCGEEWVWYNSVDQTNGDDCGFIPESVMETFIVKPENFEVCNLGHRHVTSEAVYRIPSEKERKAARHYLEFVNGKYIYVPVSR